jgi:predicted CXXCH cytochrome family protein
MKSVNFLKLTAAALCLVATSASAGTIVGSAHDFTLEDWSGGEICLACHAPHNNVNASGETLWNHTESSATYEVYSSPTFSQTADQPSGTSKLCLSCHDGTVALDSYGGATGAEFINGGAAGGTNFGTDLTNDHPISFPYVVGSEELAATTTAVTFGNGDTGAIADMLYGGSVECSSCHDVHNTKTAADTKLLLIDNAASALCLTCHTK